MTLACLLSCLHRGGAEGQIEPKDWSTMITPSGVILTETETEADKREAAALPTRSHGQRLVNFHDALMNNVLPEQPPVEKPGQVASLVGNVCLNT